MRAQPPRTGAQVVHCRREDLTVDAVARFGATVAKRFATGGGQPEEQLRGPLEQLIGDLASGAGITEPVLAGEHQLAADRVRPDYAVHVEDALVGFIEVKAPGKGVNPERYRGHDRKQWEQLACLPNVLYTDGQEFGLFRNGERIGSIARLLGDITSAGASLTAPAELAARVEDFLRWKPISPRTPRELARTTARLCRVLRAEVTESRPAPQGLPGQRLRDGDAALVERLVSSYR